MNREPNALTSSASPKRPFIVGIGGPSGTGKTTVTKRVANALGAQVISMESFYLDLGSLPPAERANRNFDAPDAIDSALLFRSVQDFAEGKDIDVPVYDFAVHTRVPGRFEHVRNGPILIVEGILVLNWANLRERFNLRVYFDAPDEVCFQRRVVRDIVDRQRSHEFVQQQYRDTVLPMAIQYVYPTKRYAEVVIDARQKVDTVEKDLLSRIKVQ
jgi:uridine kinase